MGASTVKALNQCGASCKPYRCVAYRYTPKNITCQGAPDPKAGECVLFNRLARVHAVTKADTALGRVYGVLTTSALPKSSPPPPKPKPPSPPKKSPPPPKGTPVKPRRSVLEAAAGQPACESAFYTLPR